MISMSVIDDVTWTRLVTNGDDKQLLGQGAKI